MIEHKRTSIIIITTCASVAAFGSCAATPLSNSTQMDSPHAVAPQSTQASAQEDVKYRAQSHPYENWNAVGEEGGRVEMAAQRQVFLVATETGLHLFDGEGCGQTHEGAMIRISEFSVGCSRNRLFDPETHQTCPVLCRTLAPTSEMTPSPRAGALIAYAGLSGQYLVVQTFNGFRMFERQLGCTADIPLGSELEFDSSPEGCITASVKPRGVQGGVGCALWCR